MIGNSISPLELSGNGITREKIEDGKCIHILKLDDKTGLRE